VDGALEGFLFGGFDGSHVLILLPTSCVSRRREKWWRGRSTVLHLAGLELLARDYEVGLVKGTDDALCLRELARLLCYSHTGGGCLVLRLRRKLQSITFLVEQCQDLVAGETVGPRVWRTRFLVCVPILRAVMDDPCMGNEENASQVLSTLEDCTYSEKNCRPLQMEIVSFRHSELGSSIYAARTIGSCFWFSWQASRRLTSSTVRCARQKPCVENVQRSRSLFRSCRVCFRYCVLVFFRRSRHRILSIHSKDLLSCSKQGGADSVSLAPRALPCRRQTHLTHYLPLQQPAPQTGSEPLVILSLVSPTPHIPVSPRLPATRSPSRLSFRRPFSHTSPETRPARERHIL
jgi:hypothetical protein